MNIEDRIMVGILVTVAAMIMPLLAVLTFSLIGEVLSGEPPRNVINCQEGYAAYINSYDAEGRPLFGCVEL